MPCTPAPDARRLRREKLLPAQLLNGVLDSQHVPPFINEAEKMRVDTSEGTYLSRV